jgi:eukaryotic-like serine/threonine-protein kinase
MIGQTLKQYVIEAKLGQGGMGVVYRARDTRLGRPVALKVLAQDVMGDRERRRRFIREAQSAAAVTHPAIAQIYDVDEVDGVIFIAMEFVEGRTVRQLIAAHELDLLKSIDVAIQIGGGLAKAHDAGIVHRDIKSDNVMMTSEGHAKLLDFGLAKLVSTAPSDSETAADQPTRLAASAATTAGMVLGTIAYMSPEQARGQMVDQRSDIFSLGVMLYEMCTGQMPFEGASPIDTMHAIAFEEARPVTEIRPGLPPALQRVVSRCLRKRAEDRYQGVREFVDDLRRLRSDTESGTVRAVPLAERMKDGLESLRALGTGNPVWLIAVVVLVAVLILLLASQKGQLSSLIFFAIVGMFVYRRVRNRRTRLTQKTVARLKKMPEVRFVSLSQNTLTVVVDAAQSTLYPRIHEMVDSINQKLWIGDPLTSVVRDDVTLAELNKLLQQAGVLYVRKDVHEMVRSSSAGPGSQAPPPVASA